MTEPDVRKGMTPGKLWREAFERRYRSELIDPAFEIAEPLDVRPVRMGSAM
ncbi:hypothetical protein JJC00_24770 [Bradyrhizobium diazoefficiens]|uniref:hypothetical protein n=1 Tax=Bradyrhizobium diazoefficiens TaxID=1355477 RepID=UPI00190C2AE2|nr:hypothetical protein [Bradyrhizobium diazoefficiens]QQO31813.1 hypothetical protein JJC00_24770 [Bradyrhizobium diazoefficiens]